MNQDERVRRAGIVCCHCIRNAAYYKAGRECRDSWVSTDFWRNTSNNSLDIAVLEWCKLFADPKGKHHWSKVVSEPENFLDALLAALKISASEFDVYIEKCKVYRDKFLAHLDSELVMHIPDLGIVIESATFLFNLLRCDNSALLKDAPIELSEFYQQRFDHAKTKYPNGT
jgi:hypothetical protein